MPGKSYTLLTAFIVVFILQIACAQAQNKLRTPDSIQARLILIGDAGSLVKGEAAVIHSVKNKFFFDEKTTVIYLGDNLYDHGLPDETYQYYSDIKSALDSQINLTQGTQARTIMIPGNHDWANGKREGYNSIIRQQQYVDRYSDANVNFLPKAGCPGPETVNISNDAILIIMDSQWWLHLHDKPGVESDCDTKTEEEVIDELKDILNKNYKKLVLIATHHPFKSNGPHGGYYTLKQHIFPFTDLNKKLYIPLPLIGSIYPISRSVFGSQQDISHPQYAYMINKITDAVRSHPNTIMLAGHEHNLQYIKDSSLHYIISGSGCKTNRVSGGKNALFTKQELGFATLDISKNKNVSLQFYSISKNTNDSSIKEEYAANIMNFSKLPALKAEDTVTPIITYKDVVIAPASNQYKKLNGLKKLFNGSNHRKEWSEPVQFKVFNIKKEKGGFTIEGIGGGNQTKSLKLKDSKGNEWALRTIDKDPDKAIPENFRNTFASSIVQDMISASHPYAPLATTSLEQAAGIAAPGAEFFFVPEDPAFGYYKPLFANKICVLEKRSPNNRDDNKSTFKVIDKMREDNNHTVDQQVVLHVRLLDMLIGDWDRHFDQWKWAVKDTGEGKLYSPMPKDRDQAFFRSNGLLIRLLKKNMPFLQGFSYHLNDLSELNMVARDFDRLFLNGISRHNWDSITVNFINKMTDDVIRNAVSKLPPEIYKIRGEKTIATLMNRRNELRKKSIEYYDFLSKQVTITGSNENELYKITQADGNVLVVTGYSYKRNRKDSSFVTYHRAFSPGETKEIRIYGFNGDDKFIIDSNVRTSVKFRMIGGKGNDSFLIQGPSKVHLYDLSPEKNYEKGVRNSRVHFNTDPATIEYKLRSYQYAQRSFPRINMGYNPDDGFMVGAGFAFRNYKFMREPFANEHKFGSLFAIAQKAIQLKYNGTFNRIIGRYDLLLNGRLNMPGINNFYGLGNRTQKLGNNNFHRTRYKTLEAEALLRLRKSDALNFYGGPTLFHYWNRHQNNESKILDFPSLTGLDSSDVYSRKTYAGIKLGIDINNLNNQLFPTRGVKWTTQFSWQKGIKDAVNTVTKAESDMTVYASLKIPARVTGVIKLGGGKIFSDSTKFFQALSLGQNTNLRGFRKNRFAGDGMAFGSLEFRIKLLEGKSYLIPGQVGIIVFNDAGRVWQKGEQSNKWHYSYGGGIYFVPFNTTIVSATLGKSEDGTIFNVSIGTKFNLTF